ncbi:hypothetical protein [Sinobaca sp. H24]|uniref:hypothetical protein n=1 Tax=Sinobaca sp. H24 TaxID=2923376 RepID=UPI00207A2362|nr:hypothetical protein [Sinobaca sp. H24]
MLHYSILNRTDRRNCYEHEASISTHIQPHLWEEANRRLTAKMLQEFMYEDMIHPEAGEGHWLKLAAGASTYWFSGCTPPL